MKKFLKIEILKPYLRKKYSSHKKIHKSLNTLVHTNFIKGSRQHFGNLLPREIKKYVQSIINTDVFFQFASGRSNEGTTPIYLKSLIIIFQF